MLWLAKIVATIRAQFAQTATLTVKIYPTNENIERHRLLIDPIDPSVKIIQKSDLFSLVSDSDIVLAFGLSSALFEPILLEKPLCIANYTDSINEEYYCQIKTLFVVIL
jgi:hypothetical protein